MRQISRRHFFFFSGLDHSGLTSWAMRKKVSQSDKCKVIRDPGRQLIFFQESRRNSHAKICHESKQDEVKCRLRICRTVSNLDVCFVFKVIMIDLSLLESYILYIFFHFILNRIYSTDGLQWLNILILKSCQDKYSTRLTIFFMQKLSVRFKTMIGLNFKCSSIDLNRREYHHQQKSEFL